jgi:glycosyltransferase involved in cell wall biosynthesis
MQNRLKIAYLAPEIPALSATFVYNEILRLEESGCQIVPLSVHVPLSAAREQIIDDLRNRTYYLYRTPKSRMLMAHLGVMIRRPVNYFSAFWMMLFDAVKMGLINRIGLGLFYRFFVAGQVARILLEEQCRHLHVHFAHIPADIAMYASKISGIPFSFTAHANDLFERGWLLDKKVRRARFVATISEYNRQFLSQKGAAEDKIHVIRCGVDAGNVRASNAIPKIGTLGRMVEKKGIDDLIRACKILKDQNIAFHLEIAGDGPMQSELQALVSDGNLSEQVHFTGPLAHEQVPHWLQGLDLFVLACKKDRNGDMDGIPVVLMEAMLAGVPVVSCRISGRNSGTHRRRSERSAGRAGKSRPARRRNLPAAVRSKPLCESSPKRHCQSSNRF